MLHTTTPLLPVADIDKLIIDGRFLLREDTSGAVEASGADSLQEWHIDNGVVGAGLAMFLGVRANFVNPVEVYVPKRNVRVNPANPSTAFDRSDVFISGVFALNQAKYDDQMMIVSIDLARELLRYETEVSSIDIKLKDAAEVDRVQAKIKSVLGENYLVKNRFEQQEDNQAVHAHGLLRLPGGLEQINPQHLVATEVVERRRVGTA